MSTPDVAGDRTVEDDWRYARLLEVMDLVAVHSDLEAVLPDLARCLRKVIDFEAISIILPEPGGRAAMHYQVLISDDESEQPLLTVWSAPTPPMSESRLALLLTGRTQVVLHDLDGHTDYPEIVEAMRSAGKNSLCLLPLTTVLRSVGFIGFASSRIGAYDSADLVFLQRAANHVAIAVDNVGHHQEALAYQRQLEADRDQWRALLEINNALVTNLDLASVLSAITPILRQMVPHDTTNITLLSEEGDRFGLSALDPKVPPEVAQVVTSLKLEDTPLASALAERRPLEMPVTSAMLPEPLRPHMVHAGVGRACFLPLVTSRRTLGGLSLSREYDQPFSPADLERLMRAAGQIAIAIENALAYREIERLKDRLAQENVYLEDQIRGSQHFEEIIGESKSLQAVLGQIRSVAPTDTAVLLLGETGTGKELLARSIHALSERRSRTLVTVNCATSPAGLLESEWFGHEKGAFTGALAQKVGRFELAHQGTLFLDEVGDVPLDLQAKLLRALQEHEIERLGSNRPLRVDFRLVAATNRKLEEMVAEREYRADLYYRLNVFPIHIPPLRERREDIPPLVQYFVQRYARRMRRMIDAVARESMDALCRWHWPGNVRELQNVIERAVILCQGTTLRIPLPELEGTPPPPGQAVTLEDAEREHILRALAETEWVIGGPKGAANRLGVKRTTLVSTMRRLGIVRPRPGALR